MNEILILSTADSGELARRIAATLVRSQHAACVNIVSGVRSIYRWKGDLCDDEEVLLLIKSTRGCFEAVRSAIREIHTYEVPEVIALPLTEGDQDYLLWLREQVGSCP